jgi:hypothetical protein
MAQTKHYFNAHPLNKMCYETSNGFLFHEKSAALAHAATLNDQSVVTHKRGQGRSPVKAGVVIKAIQASETLEILKSNIPEKETRRSVLAAYNKKLQALQAAKQTIDTSKI